jgi:hypothetical protein
LVLLYQKQLAPATTYYGSSQTRFPDVVQFSGVDQILTAIEVDFFNILE